MTEFDINALWALGGLFSLAGWIRWVKTENKVADCTSSFALIPVFLSLASLLAVVVGTASLGPQVGSFTVTMVLGTFLVVKSWDNPCI